MNAEKLTKSSPAKVSKKSAAMMTAIDHRRTLPASSNGALKNERKACLLVCSFRFFITKSSELIYIFYDKL